VFGAGALHVPADFYLRTSPPGHVVSPKPNALSRGFELRGFRERAAIGGDAAAGAQGFVD
jgi:hypothetical protein